MKRIRFWAALILWTSLAGAAAAAPQIELWLYNGAGVPPAVLRSAAEEAVSIFAKAGATLSWYDCPGQTCPETFSSNSFVVRILSKADKLLLSNWAIGACGIALVSGDSDFLASVDYNCVTRLSGKEEGTSAVLGHVIAHELGHLLLGTRSHGVTGLMKNRWQIAEITRIQQQALLFTPVEAARIRSALRGRGQVRSSAGESGALMVRTEP